MDYLDRMALEEQEAEAEQNAIEEEYEYYLMQRQETEFPESLNTRDPGLFYTHSYGKIFMLGEGGETGKFTQKRHNRVETGSDLIVKKVEKVRKKKKTGPNNTV